MSSTIQSQSPEDASTPLPASDVVDERSMKRVTTQFAAGVTVVTTRHGAGLHGLTVSAFMTVSWDPPLALICVERLSQSSDLIQESGVFAVNFLSDRQEFLAERFAGRAPLVSARFDGVPHHFEATGSPILDGGLGWLDCRVEQMIEVGDHVIFLGRVVRLGEGAPGNALVYFARKYRRVEP
jgi:flavin reductase (DIM6/NTAB) family NADH-FMN oxidoreductase RutF